MAKKRMRKKRRAAAQDVQRRLTAYSKAATAVLALGGGAALNLPEESAAAVQYHPNFNKTVQAPKPPAPGTGYYYRSWVTSYIDLNGDGINDLWVTHSRYRATSTGYSTTSEYGPDVYWTSVTRYYKNSAYIGPESGKMQEFNDSAMVGGGELPYSSWYFWGTYLNGTAHITSDPVFSSTSYSITWSRAPSGDMAATFGFSFKAADGIHYGWMRVRTPAKVESITILEYAYEDQPNTPIHVGNAVGGIVHDVSDVPAVEIQE